MRDHEKGLALVRRAINYLVEPVPRDTTADEYTSLIVSFLTEALNQLDACKVEDDYNDQDTTIGFSRLYPEEDETDLFLLELTEQDQILKEFHI